MKLKICGMKYPENITAVAKLQPDYMGFIFYDKSARYFNQTIPSISKNIKKTGVFVNDSLENVKAKIQQYNLQAVQLHGNESVEYCKLLKNSITENTLELIKVFSIKDHFNFEVLTPYQSVCDYFLFDTKGKHPGGNGHTFNWEILNAYPLTKPYFLSGGIGLEQIDLIEAFKASKASTYCYALDINSKFEIKPALKNTKQLNKFIKAIKKHE